MLVDFDDRVSLGLFGEFVDGDIQVLISASSRFERPKDV